MLEKMEKGIGLIERLQKLGISLSQIILLCSLGAAYWYHSDWIKTHLLLTILIVILYEVLVLVLILSKATLRFIAELWKEEFKKDALKVTATWLRAIPSKFTPGFSGRYNKQVVIDHEVFNVRGLGLISAFTLKLDQVFVDLKISPSSNPNKLNPDPIAVQAFAEARSIWDFIRASKDQSGDAIALSIIGPPGCGKTTLLQHVATTLASNKQRRFRISAHTPVLLFLRDHVSTIIDNPSISLGEITTHHFSGDRYPALKPPPNWFERQFRQGKCMVLLDGLDEVARADDRQIISQWVDRQLRNYPQCRFVVTSRPQGYQDAPLERANIVEVQPFNSKQVKNFIENWYLANEIVSAGNKIDEGVRQRAKRESDDLFKRLADPKAAALNELTVNPLLLTMIAMVHRYRGALPGSRVELYREICEVLLGRWRQSKGVLDDSLTADQKRIVLMPLAAKMMELEIREIPTLDAITIIQEPLQRVGVSGEAVGSFLNELQASSGLLLERENGRWNFAHLTFQEYITAAYWLSEKKQPSDWIILVQNSWWHETLRLYAAQGDATPILQACLSANNIASLTLAAEIMDEGAREIDEDVRRSVEDRITTTLESNDHILRRLAAEVLLSRRLSLTRSNSMLRIDDKHEIDTTYITHAEYQLFLDEMQEQDIFLHPDHWPDFRFPNGQASAPVCGVRFEDVTVFCDWLTKRQGETCRYRTPTTSEAILHLSLPLDTGVWCSEESVLLSDAKAQELRQQLLLLSDMDYPLQSIDFHTTTIYRAHDLLNNLEESINQGFGIKDNNNNVALSRNVNFKQERIKALNRARKFVSILAPLSRSEYYPVVRELKRARPRTHDIALARALTLMKEPVKSSDENGMLRLWADLVCCLIRMAMADTIAELQQAKRQYVMYLIHFSCRTLNQPKNSWGSILGRLWRQLRRYNTNEPNEWNPSECYWWLLAVMERQEGRLSAWEGIIIVRERTKS